MAVLLVILSLLVLPSYGFAATLYADKANTCPGVGTIGDPFCTVQQASDASNAGDIIEIVGGSYTESVTVSRSGTSGNYITFKPKPQTGTVFFKNDNAGQYLGAWRFMNGTSWVRLEGITFKDSPANYAVQIEHTESNQGDVNFFTPGETGAPANSMDTTVHHIQIVGNTFQNVGNNFQNFMAPVLMKNVRDIEILDNIFIDTYGYHIYNLSSYRNIIRGNTITGGRGSFVNFAPTRPIMVGIQVAESGGVEVFPGGTQRRNGYHTIENNTITAAAVAVVNTGDANGIWCNEAGHNSLVKGNIVSGHSRGVYLDGRCHAWEVTENQLYQNQLGLQTATTYVFTTHNHIIHHNVMYLNSQWGAAFFRSELNEFRDNILYNNVFGQLVVGSESIPGTIMGGVEGGRLSLGGNTFFNNLMFKDGTTDVGVWDCPLNTDEGTLRERLCLSDGPYVSGVIQTFTSFNSLSGSTGNVNSDPLFVDKPADFNLNPGSPAIDADSLGTDMGAYPGVVVIPNTIAQSGMSIFSVSSQEEVSETAPASNALDGDILTHWHSGYTPSAIPYPHFVVFDLGATYELTQIGTVSRRGHLNGVVADFEIYVSSSGSGFPPTPDATNTGSDTATSLVTTLPADTIGRYVMFKAINAVNGREFAALAEFTAVGTPAEEPAGTTHWVSKETGDDTRSCLVIESQNTPAQTIQRGINCHNGPGQVIVGPGSYPEFLYITEPQAGVSGDPFILRAQTPGTVTINVTGLSHPNAFWPVIYVSNTSYVHVQDISIVGAAVSDAIGTEGVGAYNSSHHILFDNLVINGTKNSCVVLSDHSVNNITVQNSVFQNTGGDFCIFVQEAEDIKILNNRFTHDTSTGNLDSIAIQNSQNVLVEGNLIECGCDGIDVGGDSTTLTDLVIIRSNTVQDAGSANGCTTDRAFAVSGGSGNSPLGNHHISFLHNVASGLLGSSASGSGFEASQGAHDLVYFGNVAYNTFRPLWLKGQCFPTGNSFELSDIDIRNNIFVGTLDSPGAISQWDMDDPGSVTLKSNHLYSVSGDRPLYLWDEDGIADGVFCSDPDIASLDLAAFTTSTSEGTTSATGDPLFAGVSTDDFSLASGSGAIDSGDFYMLTDGGGTDTSTITVDCNPRQYFTYDDQFYLHVGDTIQVEDATPSTVRVTGLSATTITVTPTITFSTGKGVHRPWLGDGPDKGAYDTSTAGGMTAEVPDVVGLTQAAATSAINAVSGLSTGTVTQASSESVAVGLVISQNPAGGTLAFTPAIVTFEISTGPSGSVVDNESCETTGTQVETSDNLTTILDASSGGDVFLLRAGTHTLTADAEFGFASSSNPITVKPYNCEAVTISINSGFTIVMEDWGILAGLTITGTGNNVVTLESLGASTVNDNVIRNNVITGSVPVRVTGRVTRTLIEGNDLTSSIDIDSVIIIEEGNGVTPTATTCTNNLWNGTLGSECTAPDEVSTVAVPDVVDTTEAAATSTIEAAGLVVGVVTDVDAPGTTVGEVASQSPVATTVVVLGSAVDLNISAAATVAVPTCIGLTQAAGEAAIEAAGLVVGTIDQVDAPGVTIGEISACDPVATTQVTLGSTVDIDVSAFTGTRRRINPVILH